MSYESIIFILTASIAYSIFILSVCLIYMIYSFTHKK